MVFADHIDKLLVLIGAHSASGNQQYLHFGGCTELNIGVHAGCQGPVGIIKDGPRPDGSAGNIQLIIERMDFAPVNPVVVRQCQFYRHRRGITGGPD